MTPEHAPADEPLLSIRDLEVTYPGRERTTFAVNGVSLDIREGTAWGLVGETGCGKSSLVRAVVGLLPGAGRISAGSVSLRGRDIAASNPKQLRRIRAREIAFMPQNALAALHPVLSVERQFRDVLRVCLPKDQRRDWRERSERMLAEVGIADPRRVMTSYVHELSGGMAQRVVLALVMIREPLVVIADEPTTGLDLRILRQSMDLLTKMRREKGTAIVLVTHDLGVVAQYCSSMAVMYGGEVVESGPVRSVLDHPTHPYTAALIGSVPTVNHPLVTTGGSVPILVEPPTRCAFYERCPHRHDTRCADRRPPLVEVRTGHRVASFCVEQAPEGRTMKLEHQPMRRDA